MKLLRRLAALIGPRRPIVVNVHVQGSVRSDRELAEIIQRELLRRPPGRTA